MEPEFETDTEADIDNDIEADIEAEAEAETEAETEARIAEAVARAQARVRARPGTRLQARADKRVASGRRAGSRSGAGPRTTPDGEDEAPRRGKSARWIEILEDWGALFGIGIAIVLIVLGFRFSVIGTPLAYALALGVPVVAVLSTVWSHFSMTGGGRWLGLAVAVAMVAAAETAVVGAVFPPHPDAELALAPGDQVSVDLPAGSHALTVAAHGELTGRASAEYEIDLSRGEDEVRVEGRLERAFHRGRRVRGMPTGSETVHETDLHDVTVPGDGPVEVELASLKGSMKPPLHVAIMHSRHWPRWAAIGALALVALAGIAQTVARRRRHISYLAMGCGVAAAFCLLYALYYNPDSRLGFAIGTTFFGVIAGGVGGGIVGRVIGGPVQKPTDD